MCEAAGPTAKGRNPPEGERKTLLTLTLEGRKEVFLQVFRQICQLGAGAACIFLVRKEVQLQNIQRQRWTGQTPAFRLAVFSRRQVGMKTPRAHYRIARWNLGPESESQDRLCGSSVGTPPLVGLLDFPLGSPQSEVSP